MNFDAIAQAAYEKWATTLHVIPRWHNLTPLERAAWKAAVIEAIDIHVAAVMA